MPGTREVSDAFVARDILRAMSAAVAQLVQGKPLFSIYSAIPQLFEHMEACFTLLDYDCEMALVAIHNESAEPIRMADLV